MIHTDLIGVKFGRWAVVGTTEGEPRHKKVRCRCDCGKEKDVFIGNLKRGLSVSCGCYFREQVSTHGRTRTPEHMCWINMTQRCLNENHDMYPYYGGRGITVCPRWLFFENFYEDMGDRPSDKHSLDRIDNDGSYSPENCRWATKKEQQNNRRVCKRYTLNGVTQSLADWAKTLDVNEGSLSTRLRLGWSVEDTLTIPVKKRRKA